MPTADRRPTPLLPGTCARCGAPVWLVRDLDGCPTVLDPDPSLVGDVAVTTGGTLCLSPAAVARWRAEGTLYVRHQTTCPGGTGVAP